MARTKCLHDELPLEQYNKVEKTCKLCGKSYYNAWTKSGYSDFCSSTCSRAFSTKEKRKQINEKVSKALEGRNTHLEAKLGRIVDAKKEYENNPKYCIVCGNKLPFSKKNRSCCSNKCLKKILSNRIKKLFELGKLSGGYRRGSSRGRSGFYKGIWCDSTYELVYLIYCLDNKVEIKRCQDVFTYEIDGKIKKYHPDFIVNGNIVEIKNYWRKEVDFKCDAVRRTGKEITVLYTRDLEPYMSYVDKKYGLTHKGKSNKYYVLYDKTEHG